MKNKFTSLLPHLPNPKKIFITTEKAYGSAFVASFGIYFQEPHPRYLQSVDQHLYQECNQYLEHLVSILSQVITFPQSQFLAHSL